MLITHSQSCLLSLNYSESAHTWRRPDFIELIQVAVLIKVFCTHKRVRRWRVEAVVDIGLESEEHVYLVDHAWTYRQARRSSHYMLLARGSQRDVVFLG